MVSSVSSKSELRQAFRLRMHGAANGDAAGDEAAMAARASEQSDALGAQLERLFKTQRFPNGIWAAFQPVGFEADVRPMLMSLEFDRGIEWAYPRVVGQELEFLLPDDPAVFTENQWGILEPDPATSRVLGASELSGLLIPALAFDMNCNRLGRGGGFYDRSLARIQTENKSTIKIGIGFDAQISDTSLPIEPFDIPMDWVVTNTRAFSRVPSTAAQRKTT
jgi:5-formyltetrahydrofolate cyclo-ligase